MPWGNRPLLFIARRRMARAAVTGYGHGMKDPLGTYLHDHLAGARFAVEMLAAVRDDELPPDVSLLAAELLQEIESDRHVLETLAKAVEADSGAIKDAMGWLAEKASRLKLRRHDESSLGLFETFEALSLGILGKKALWDALAVAASADSRLAGPDYGALSVRAYRQHVRVEEKRIELAKELFSPRAHLAGSRSG